MAKHLNVLLTRDNNTRYKEPWKRLRLILRARLTFFFVKQPSKAQKAAAIMWQGRKLDPLYPSKGALQSRLKGEIFVNIIICK